MQSPDFDIFSLIQSDPRLNTALGDFKNQTNAAQNNLVIEHAKAKGAEVADLGDGFTRISRSFTENSVPGTHDNWFYTDRGGAFYKKAISEFEIEEGIHMGVSEFVYQQSGTDLSQLWLIATFPYVRSADSVEWGDRITIRTGFPAEMGVVGATFNGKGRLGLLALWADSVDLLKANEEAGEELLRALSSDIKQPDDVDYIADHYSVAKKLENVKRSILYAFIAKSENGLTLFHYYGSDMGVVPDSNTRRKLIRDGTTEIEDRELFILDMGSSVGISTKKAGSQIEELSATMQSRLDLASLTKPLTGKDDGKDWPAKIMEHLAVSLALPSMDRRINTQSIKPLV